VCVLALEAVLVGWCPWGVHGWWVCWGVDLSGVCVHGVRG